MQTLQPELREYILELASVDWSTEHLREVCQVGEPSSNLALMQILRSRATILKISDCFGGFWQSLLWNLKERGERDLLLSAYQSASYFHQAKSCAKIQAEALLKQKVNNGLRSEFGTRTIPQIVSGERSELMNEAMEQASSSSDELGIEIVDVRVKQINLPLEVSNSIFQRMRAERAAVAREHRSEGQEQADIIRADIDARVTVMLADAERNARQLRGEGDAEAANIYANTYSKNPEFYSFLRSMDAYRSSFNSKQDVLIVDPSSDFFNYLNSQTGERK